MEQNNEVETKILEVDFDTTLKKIIQIGGKLDFFRNEFIAIWMENELGKRVRVRKEGAKVKIEHKQSISSVGGVKTAMETPALVTDDLEIAINLFEKLGFRQTSKSVKDRTSCILDLSETGGGEAVIVIDEYSNLKGIPIPALLEIEAQSRDVIVKVARLLGYNEGDFNDWGADVLGDYYKAKQAKAGDAGLFLGEDEVDRLLEVMVAKDTPERV